MTNITAVYNWSGKHTDAFDLLNYTTHNFSEDVAGNNGVITAGPNTKVIFKKLNGDFIKEESGVRSLIFTPDSEAPNIISSNFLHKNSRGDFVSIYSGNSTIYFAADEAKEFKVSDFGDNGAGLRDFILAYENHDNPYTKKEYKNQRDIIHNFSKVSDLDYNTDGYRLYSWDLISEKVDGSRDYSKVCDLVGNCTPIITSDFKVVAADPDISYTRHDLDKLLGVIKIANYSDKYENYIYFRDKYNNYVVPVLGVKDIKINIDYINSLGRDQVNNPSLGDGVGFIFKDGDGRILNSGSSYVNHQLLFSQESSFNNGELYIELKSAVPTKEEYNSAINNRFKPGQSLYGTNTAKLQLDSLKIEVINKTNYSDVGELSPALELATVGNKPSYKFSPIININKIDSISPLVEGQEKSINISGFGASNNFELDMYLGSNNLFLDFELVKINNEFIYPYDPSLGSFKFDNDNFDISGSASFSFKPKTVGGIEGLNKHIAVFTNLKYNVSGVDVVLPSIQDGFELFGPRNEYIDFGQRDNYNSNAIITISEIDIKGLSQTHNKLGYISGFGATTTDNSTFNDFSNITLLDLKTNIRQNVNTALKGLDRDRGDISTNGVILLEQGDLDNFASETNGLKLQNNNIIYFKGGDVKIACGITCSISGKKTIIVEDGNILLDSNLKYTNPSASLGIILLQDNSKSGKAMLKVKSSITNGVGIIYAEGPVVSYNGNDKNHIYDGRNIGSTGLANQLYWKGSFATRNTIGGSVKFSDFNSLEFKQKACPYGTPEYESSNCTPEKAQSYDLIYLRRYAMISGTLYGCSDNIPLHSNSMNVYLAGGAYYNNCTFVRGGLAIPDDYNISAPFILEYDSNMGLNPPLLFNK